MHRKLSKSSKLLGALGVAVFAVTLGGYAPASLIAPLAGASSLSYGRVEGTIWKGVIADARVDGVSLGDISYRLRPGALLRGKLAAAVEARGGAVSGHGIAAAGWGEYSFRDGEVMIDLGSVRRYAFLGAPLEGRGRARIEDLTVSEKGCRRADATVWTDALNAPAQRLNGEGFELNGAARCDGGDLIVELSGSGAEGGANLALHLKPGFAYTLEASAQPSRAELEQALVYMGFQQENGVLTYASTGTIRTAGS
ncbi:MAG: type II secretion system protein N [Pseudomonadota bacterium]|nr:type II secretion system protein N [Pseudomonadota bacterium]